MCCCKEQVTDSPYFLSLCANSCVYFLSINTFVFSVFGSSTYSIYITIHYDVIFGISERLTLLIIFKQFPSSVVFFLLSFLLSFLQVPFCSFSHHTAFSCCLSCCVFLQELFFFLHFPIHSIILILFLHQLLFPPII